MTNEEIEQKITQLEREIHLARKAWRIDYDELTERLDNLGIKNLTEIAKQIHELRDEMNAIQDRYDKNNHRNKK